MAQSVISSLTKDNSTKRNETSIYNKQKTRDNSDSKFQPSEVTKEVSVNGPSLMEGRIIERKNKKKRDS